MRMNVGTTHSRLRDSTSMHETLWVHIHILLQLDEVTFLDNMLAH